MHKKDKCLTPLVFTSLYLFLLFHVVLYVRLISRTPWEEPPQPQQRSTGTTRMQFPSTLLPMTTTTTMPPRLLASLPRILIVKPIVQWLLRSDMYPLP